MTNQLDFILQAGWVVTVDDNNTVLENYSVVIRNGAIVTSLPHQQATAAHPDLPVLDRSDCIVMPGLVNSHTHLAMNLLRGYADDLPLMTWLQDHIWPAEAEHVNREFVAAGTRLAVAESLLGGVTCCNDMYFFPDAVAEVASAAGMRAVVGMIVLDFPTVWAADADNYLQRGLELHDALRDNALVSTCFAPHAPYTVSREPLERIATLATELDLRVHIHVHETAAEVDAFVAQHGVRPLARLHEIGLVNPDLLAVHMTQLTHDEIDLVATQGARVLHSPESNLKLASGAAPVAQLLDAGVTVALGTDGAASNNDIDMFGEMRTAALLCKHTAEDAAAMPAATALRIATINGARSLGLEQHIGSIETGKSADLITVSTAEVGMQPLYDPVSHLVYAAQRSEVRDVWVAGQCLVADRDLLTLDRASVIDEARQWQTQINRPR